jgi:hypothetical protein
MLRGRILRDSGQYDAAEVAFDAAMQSAEHDIPRHDADREVQATRRAASLGGKRPARFTARERAFVVAGCVVLDDGADPALEPVEVARRSLALLPALVRELGWHPAAVAGVTPADLPLADAVARDLGAQVVGAAALDPADRPLLVTVYNARGEEWTKQLARLDRWRAGTTFALFQAGAADGTADVVGTLRSEPSDAAAAAAGALREPAATVALPPEVTALAASPLASWRRRIAAT